MWRTFHGLDRYWALLSGRMLPLGVLSTSYRQEVADSIGDGSRRLIEWDELCCKNCGMSNRTREIFEAIHRAPMNGRQVLALSRADAEQFPLFEDVAMISITAPERPLAQLPEYPFLLRMSFSDVDFLSADLSERAKAKLPNAMTRQQAEEIIEFVRLLPESVKSLLVHCEGGFSRSCGVVAALGEIFNFTVEKKRLADANPSVKKLLLKTANGDGKVRRRR